MLTMLTGATLSEQLTRLDDVPADPTERIAAKRALVRYEKIGDEGSQACASEDWIRLFIALRRATSPSTRITPQLLMHWKTKVTASTTVNSKCFLVETAAIDALVVYPPYLDRWVIPRESLDLPPHV